jgi:Rrf2 family transcriptional regulator, cysteine metabolism repressor
MSISQKCQYAVRALLELAKRNGQSSIRSSQIAARQAIPPRFLVNILTELKAAGLVEARRGAHGGFVLAVRPEELTVGQVIRLVDGPLDQVSCTQGSAQRDCPLKDRCSLLQLWQQAKTAVESVYDGATFADLAARELALEHSAAAEYTI